MIHELVPFIGYYQAMLLFGFSSDTINNILNNTTIKNV